MQNILKIIKNYIKNSLNCNNLCLLGAQNVEPTQNNYNKWEENVSYFWQPAMESRSLKSYHQKNTKPVKSIREKSNEKMKVNLNNLKQKLLNNDELLSQVAELIEKIVETNSLTSKLSGIQTNLENANEQIQKVIENANNDLTQYINIVVQNMLNVLNQNGVNTSEEYMNKIYKTVEYAVENYEAYLESDYAHEYGSGAHIEKATSNICSILDK